MIAALIAIGILGVAMTCLHMVRPYALKRTLSVARFLGMSPEPTKAERRWTWSNPLKTHILYPRLLLLALVFAAVSLHRSAITRAASPHAVGVWLWIDTSASMGAVDGGGVRLDQALADATRRLEETMALESVTSLCIRVTAFDHERRDLLTSGNIDSARVVMSNLEPRALGTDLSLVSNGVNAGGPSDIAETDACAITDIVVLSDAPMPAADNLQTDARVMWLSTAPPIANAGINSITLAHNMSADLRLLAVDVRGYGESIGTLNLRLERLQDAGNVLTEVDSQAIEWQIDGATKQAIVNFGIEQAGRYRITLDSADGYTLDNSAEVVIPQETPLRVDWRAESPDWVALLGWHPESGTPELRVQNADDPLPADGVPTLLIGSGFGSPFQVSNVGLFAEESTLLKRLNLDAAEGIGMDALASLAEMPPGFSAILGNNAADPLIWVAERLTPPAVYIPGLPAQNPLGQEDSHFTATLFYNAVTRLTSNRQTPPLYTLTTPLEPTVAGNRVALFPDEGNTMYVGQSVNEREIGSDPPELARAESIWHWIVLTAMVLLGIERTFSARRKL